MGCPVYLMMFYSYSAKGHVQGRKLVSFSFMVFKLQRRFLALVINSEWQNLFRTFCLLLKSEFSVERNLLEKAFAYTRGSVGFEYKIG